MKHPFLLTLMLFWAAISVGQPKSNKVDILWGPELKESKKSTLSDVIGYDETGMYALKTKRKILGSGSITIEHFDHQLAKTKSVEIELNDQKKDREFEQLLFLNKELFLLSSYADQKTKKNTLYLQRVDKSSLQLQKELTKVGEIDYSGNRKLNAGNFGFELSDDSTKVLIYYNLPFDKGEKEKFGFHVYDNQFNPLWAKKVTLPYLEELFDVEDYEVDNSGNVHLLGLIYKEKRKTKRKGDPNYKYQILSYSNQGSALEEYPIQIKDKFLTDMQIAINEEQDIICGGFYSAEGTYSIEGSYFLKIDSDTKEIKSKAFQEFGIDFVTQNLSNREEKASKRKDAKGKNVELYRYELDDIILRTDGGAILVGEQYYVRAVTSTTTDGNGLTRTTTVYYYYYNDIIVINMSSSGEIEWTEKIAKRQTTTNDGGFFSSYALSIVKDKMYFVFNDNPKNLFYKGEGKVHNVRFGRESVVVLVTLDSNGKQTRDPLFLAKDADVIIRPKVCEQISRDELILFGQKKKTQRFAKARFKHSP